VNNSREGDGRFRQNQGKGAERGSKVQNKIIGNGVAPEGFVQGQLAKPELPE
jgi:hypothetical protein